VVHDDYDPLIDLLGDGVGHVRRYPVADLSGGIGEVHPAGLTLVDLVTDGDVTDVEFDRLFPGLSSCSATTLSSRSTKAATATRQVPCCISFATTAATNSPIGTGVLINDHSAGYLTRRFHKSPSGKMSRRWNLL
jgi:hypothetical protein